MENHIDLTTMNSNRLHKWAADKNPICAYVAFNTVAATDNMHNFIIALQNANISQQMNKEARMQWLELCKHPKLIQVYLLSEMFKRYAPVPLVKLGLHRIAKIALKSNRRQRERLGKMLSQKFSEKDIEVFLEDLMGLLSADIENSITEIKNEPSNENYTPDMGEVFVLNNLLRCQIEYTESFYSLFHKARTGNTEAMVKLLRLDPLVLEDHFIRNHFLTAGPSLLKKYQTAINNPLKYHTKPEKIKATMSGFISALFESFTGNPITPREIHNLFEAFAMDAHQKDSDDNLPYEFDAFRKSVKKHHQLWKPMTSKIYKALS